MKIELSLHAHRLKNVAGRFKGTSDPYAVVTQIANDHKSKPVVLGKTEVIENCLNPEWVKTFILDYDLGTTMKVAVSIFDNNNVANMGEEEDSSNKSNMGNVIFDIGELLGIRGNTKAKRIQNYNGATVYAHVRKVQGRGLLRLQLSGNNLKNTEGFLRKSDPMYEIRRQINNNATGSLTWDSIYRSNVVQNDLNPVWETAVIELSTLCDGNIHLPLQITVYDYERSGKHIIMGQCETNVYNLNNNYGKSMELSINGKKTGELIIQRIQLCGLDDSEIKCNNNDNNNYETSEEKKVIEEENIIKATKPTFIDYITGGCELNVIVAIDFTGSNGDPRIPGTLHHINNQSHIKNQYEKAMSSIVEILAKYDSNKMFPVYGFGAKYDGIVQHCFPCNAQSEEVKGVQGVLDAYRKVFKSGLIMSSPTVFTEVMKTAAVRSQSALSTAQANGCLAYTVLLIVTDGAVSDVNATADCLKEISVDSPLSIVIVGVGDADFSAMQFLDDLKGSSSSSTGGRDMVQFVEFNKHSTSKQSLTSATLHEIPDQLVEYFQRKGSEPGDVIKIEDDEITIETDDEEDEIDLSLDFIGEEEIVITHGGYDTTKSSTWIEI